MLPCSSQHDVAQCTLRKVILECSCNTGPSATEAEIIWIERTSHSSVTEAIVVSTLWVRLQALVKDSIINLEESRHIQRFFSSRVIVEHCPWHMRAIFLILRFLSKWTCTLRTIWNRKAQPLMSLVLELSKQLSSILGERERERIKVNCVT